MFPTGPGLVDPDRIGTFGRLDAGPVSFGHYKRGKSQNSIVEESIVVKFRWKRLERPEDARI
jgi:hypothetical protein